MNIDLKQVFTITMVLFAVIDIIGSVPIIVSLRNKVGHIQSEKASIASFFIMVLFLFIGDQFLKIIGLTVNSFAVAGAIVLFFLALEMILGIHLYRDDEAHTASIVPIAFPLVAGTGTLTTLLSLKAEFETINIIIGIFINILLVYAVLKSSAKIEKILGKTGLSIVRKVFGIVLLAIAVKLFAANVKALFI
ncbi:MarC family protein [Flavobacterium branchiophilum]|uniref:UPF0056 inner membrane protein n=1 Tax=Flavobacterium branchiophilum (strain FL-15) TaxID=1034807 RepID=G2Z516_FLABF|nr:MarC family protein [Flavobacterium branchiophilum]CCB70740.1 MarC family integral membrane protein [Flavobacterium branchiophilum FL-15]